MYKKYKLKICDIAFAHSVSSSDNIPKWVEWDRTPIKPSDTCFFTDLMLPHAQNYFCKKKIAWLLEPPCIINNSYSFVERNPDLFDYILTHNLEWKKNQSIELQNKILYYPMGAVWTKPQDVKIYPKTSNLSIIASDKNYAPGHKLRHEVVRKFGNYIDGLFGRGYQPIQYKLDGHRNYRFSLAIMNMRLDDYFTDIILDCFAAGTVPIWWGTPNINKYFNSDGIIQFETLEELENILSSLNEDLYQSMLPAIEDNIQRVEQYRTAEDWFIQQYGQLLL